MEYINKFLRKSGSKKSEPAGHHHLPPERREFAEENEFSCSQQSTPKKQLDCDTESDTTAEYESAGEASPWEKPSNLSALADYLAGVHLSTPDKIHTKLTSFPFSPISAEDECDEEVTAIISNKSNSSSHTLSFHEREGLSLPKEDKTMSCVADTSFTDLDEFENSIPCKRHSEANIESLALMKSVEGDGSASGVESGEADSCRKEDIVECNDCGSEKECVNVATSFVGNVEVNNSVIVAVDPLCGSVSEQLPLKTNAFNLEVCNNNISANETLAHGNTSNNSFSLNLSNDLCLEKNPLLTIEDTSLNSSRVESPTALIIEEKDHCDKSKSIINLKSSPTQKVLDSSHVTDYVANTKQKIDTIFSSKKEVVTNAIVETKQQIDNMFRRKSPIKELAINTVTKTIDTIKENINISESRSSPQKEPFVDKKQSPIAMTKQKIDSFFTALSPNKHKDVTEHEIASCSESKSTIRESLTNVSSDSLKNVTDENEQDILSDSSYISAEKEVINITKQRIDKIFESLSPQKVSLSVESFEEKTSNDLDIEEDICRKTDSDITNKDIQTQNSMTEIDLPGSSILIKQDFVDVKEEIEKFTEFPPQEVTAEMVSEESNHDFAIVETGDIVGKNNLNLIVKNTESNFKNESSKEASTLSSESNQFVEMKFSLEDKALCLTSETDSNNKNFNETKEEGIKISNYVKSFSENSELEIVGCQSHDLVQSCSEQYTMSNSEKSESVVDDNLSHSSHVSTQKSLGKKQVSVSDLEDEAAICREHDLDISVFQSVSGMDKFTEVISPLNPNLSLVSPIRTPQKVNSNVLLYEKYRSIGIKQIEFDTQNYLTATETNICSFQSDLVDEGVIEIKAQIDNNHQFLKPEDEALPISLDAIGHNNIDENKKITFMPIVDADHVDKKMPVASTSNPPEKEVLIIEKDINVDKKIIEEVKVITTREESEVSLSLSQMPSLAENVDAYHVDKKIYMASTLNPPEKEVLTIEKAINIDEKSIEEVKVITTSEESEVNHSLTENTLRAPYMIDSNIILNNPEISNTLSNNISEPQNFDNAEHELSFQIETTEQDLPSQPILDISSVKEGILEDMLDAKQQQTVVLPKIAETNCEILNVEQVTENQVQMNLIISPVLNESLSISGKGFIIDTAIQNQSSKCNYAGSMYPQKNEKESSNLVIDVVDHLVIRNQEVENTPPANIEVKSEDLSPPVSSRAKLDLKLTDDSTSVIAAESEQISSIEAESDLKPQGFKSDLMHISTNVDVSTMKISDSQIYCDSSSVKETFEYNTSDNKLAIIEVKNTNIQSSGALNSSDIEGFPEKKGLSPNSDLQPSPKDKPLNIDRDVTNNSSSDDLMQKIMATIPDFSKLKAFEVGECLASKMVDDMIEQIKLSKIKNTSNTTSDQLDKIVVDVKAKEEQDKAQFIASSSKEFEDTVPPKLLGQRMNEINGSTFQNVRTSVWTDFTERGLFVDSESSNSSNDNNNEVRMPPFASATIPSENLRFSPPQCSLSLSPIESLVPGVKYIRPVNAPTTSAEIGMEKNIATSFKRSELVETDLLKQSSETPSSQETALLGQGEMTTRNEKLSYNFNNKTAKDSRGSPINKSSEELKYCGLSDSFKTFKLDDLSKTTIERKSYEDLLDRCLEQERLLGFDESIKEEADKLIKELANASSDSDMSQPNDFPLGSVNSSEAGPVTADEDLNKGDLFQDATLFDFDYLSKIGKGKPSRRLVRESLFLKFDPLAAAAAATPEPAEMAQADSSSDAIATPPRAPLPNGDDKLVSITPNDEGVSSPASSTVATPPRGKPRPASASATPTLRHEILSKEISKLQDLMLRQECSYQEQIAACTEEVELLREKVAELEARENQENLQEKLTVTEAEASKLRKELADTNDSKKQLMMIMEEYEKTISQVVTMREDDRKNFEIEKEQIGNERDEAVKHLRNMEIAFNDVHQKYEKCKEVIEAFKHNEEQYKISLNENRKTIIQQEENYQKLKEHAAQKLEQANIEISEMKKAHQAELAKMVAVQRKMEIQVKSLEESLEQKKREAAELTKICDDLITKVEQ